MNVLLTQDISIYRLALDKEKTSQSLSLKAISLLALLRAQIDLLIEQQIVATLWVKLPPGKIWQAELARYHRAVADGVIYYCQAPEGETSVFKIRREYFLLTLSPQFSSVTVAVRPPKKLKNQKTARVNPNANLSFVTVSSIEEKVIQQVITGLKGAIAPESASILDNFEPSQISSPALFNSLFSKQLQHQDKLQRLVMKRRITKVETQKQTLQTNLQIKDDNLSHVCQELRAPLTHMKTALSLLNSPTLKIPQRQRYMDMLKDECDRQNSLINGVLELVQIERNLEDTTLESLHLADIVPGVVSTYQPLAQEKGIMLAYTIPTDLPPVWCVSGGLRQIVIHLLANSIKFTPNGGQVWVRARLQGDNVQLEFRDTGIGIADTDISKIFDRFYRVRPLPNGEASGVGLGLTIVQQLLQHSGGSIVVKSKLNEGSTFTVQLMSTSSPEKN
ncbi:ATP-binding protein [Calothrix sp. 336/3]|uniref:ATP-binding protein n=1 Tax=Calothrix sp. 336/3 TaxID=1337936 RepID=UPI0004E34BB1|nr:ATP-binding protein [Calothrix sp. 336/3]AKG20712.1 ATPase [Calothrix sp. 336/3]